jgi:hypothetical protein
MLRKRLPETDRSVQAATPRLAAVEADAAKPKAPRRRVPGEVLHR